MGKVKSTDARIVLALLALQIRLVPEWGQAATVQGELVRAFRQLQGACVFRWQGLPYDGGVRQTFASYLRHHLGTGNVFDAETLGQVEQDLAMLGGCADPETVNQQLGTDALSRLQARVVAWCEHHPELVTREVTEEVACAR